MKRICCLILALLMAFGLFGCGRDVPQITLPPAATEEEPGTSIDVPTVSIGQDETAPSQTAGLPYAEATLRGVIVQVTDTTVLLAGERAADLYTLSSSVPLYDEDAKPTQERPTVGWVVEIGYSGEIMESYPGQLGQPVYIKQTGAVRDTITLYRKVIDDLWQTDTALNTDIDYIAFDLQGAANLNEGEQAALGYLTGAAYGKEVLFGTWKELCEQGYIDKDNLYFENGVLFTISVLEENGDTFTFDAEKWRSGLGAYFFMDCTAKRTKTGWTYEVGAHAIS